MKLINKKDLTLMDGYLIAPNGEVISKNNLAKEINELKEIADLMTFLKANKKAILASSKPVVYKPEPVAQTPRFTTSKTVETPILDADIERAKALAEEFLGVQSIKDIDHHLARYDNLARWFAFDYIQVPAEPVNVLPVKFEADILTFTEAEVISIVEDMHDPELAKLRDLVTIDFT